MMRGEADSIGGMSWEAIQTNHQDWLTEKKIRVLYAQGAQRITDLPNDPGLLDFAVDDRSRQILGLLGSGLRYRPLRRGRARHPAGARRGAAPRLHGDHAGSRIRRRNRQAQPHARAAERRGGAEDGRRPSWRRRRNWSTRRGATSVNEARGRRFVFVRTRLTARSHAMPRRNAGARIARRLRGHSRSLPGRSRPRRAPIRPRGSRPPYSGLRLRR